MFLTNWSARRHPTSPKAIRGQRQSNLRRGEFLLLIIGDGIREGVENIVNFVQSHSGLHFNLALVEAALYRDTDSRIIVQPRVLTRTEVVRRVVIEGGFVEDLTAEDGVDEAPPHGYKHEFYQENARFWTAVLDNYVFSDVTVEPPEGTRQPQLYIKVQRSGWGDWGLSFVGFLDRGNSIVGCYLTRRKDVQPGVDVYEAIERSLNELRRELGNDLEQWEQDGRPRIGFKRPTQFPFPSEESPSAEFADAVEWMCNRLDRLVSTLHPRLQRMISAAN